MKVKTYNTYNLYPVNIPFKLSIVWKTKSSAKYNNGWWFTPSGQGKIGLDWISWNYSSSIDKETDAEIIKMMIKYKCDFLTDGRDFYTRLGNGIAKVINASTLMNEMIEQWSAGSNTWTIWEDKKLYRTDLADLEPII